MQCTSCGAPYKQGDIFCPSCGTKLQPVLNEALKDASALELVNDPSLGAARLLMLGTLLLGCIFQALVYSLRRGTEALGLFYAAF
ncbi:MAG TPA: zinc-ribbon domain-containing protein, partial [Clostridia bacterium]|nr:zinc-ribbon domain-containing protein [Clostridia bacterium]